MHRSIYISKNNGINIVCLLVKLYFGQILPLLIRRLVGSPPRRRHRANSLTSVALATRPPIVRKRFLFINGVTIICEGRQSSAQDLASQKENEEYGSQSLKGEHRQLYIKVRLCVLWSFATYAKESSMEPFAAL